jgi:hypothetical protein
MIIWHRYFPWADASTPWDHRGGCTWCHWIKPRLCHYPATLGPIRRHWRRMHMVSAASETPHLSLMAKLGRPLWVICLIWAICMNRVLYMEYFSLTRVSRTCLRTYGVQRCHGRRIRLYSHAKNQEGWRSSLPASAWCGARTKHVAAVGSTNEAVANMYTFVPPTHLSSVCVWATAGQARTDGHYGSQQLRRRL